MESGAKGKAEGAIEGVKDAVKGNGRKQQDDDGDEQDDDDDSDS
jgi:hypothetical protein